MWVAARTSETSVNFYQTTQRNNQAEGYRHSVLLFAANEISPCRLYLKKRLRFSLLQDFTLG
jgi:hypothetical protein